MRKKKRSKKIALVLACFLIPAATFGVGYFLKQYTLDKAVAKTLIVEGNIGGTISEQNIKTDNIVPGDTIYKSIAFTSISTAPSLIRAKIEPVWEGNLSSENLELVYSDGVKVKESIISGETAYWYKHSDGYFYYMGPVKQKSDIKLVKGFKFNGGTDDKDANEYQNKGLNIKITMDIIQSKYSPFEEKWNIKGSNLADELKNLCSSVE